MKRFSAVAAMVGLTFPLPLASAVFAQEENGAFEYSPWSADGAEASVVTSVNDAENKLVLSCGTGSRGIITEHSLEIASADSGEVLPEGWGNSIRTVTLKTEKSGRSQEYIPLFIEEVRENFYGPTLSFRPAERSGDWYDQADARMMQAIMRADRVTISILGETGLVVFSFTGGGSSQAIANTFWCNPTDAL